jgi:glucosamine kinase
MVMVSRRYQRMERDLNPVYEFLIGVDGGGTGTRACIARADGVELARGSSGPSALMHGSAPAWAAVLAAVQHAFGEAGLALPALDRIAIGLGMAGVHNKQWAADFAANNPGFGMMALATDAFTTLLGAHQGQPGAIVAIGTGSVGEALLADGTRREVGGWGFPSSDEAGGAWLGMRAINHAQRVLDGRAASGEFARAVIGRCCGDRDGVFAWLAGAGQGAYAQLAPLVIEHAPADQAARDIMVLAGQEIAQIAAALDPTSRLPIALCGGLAAPVRGYLPEPLAARVVMPTADAVGGALQLIRRRLEQEERELRR